MTFKPPKETLCAMRDAGLGKASLSLSKLLVLGFLAGAFIAFGGLLAIIVGGGVPEIRAANPGLQRFIFGATFPFGLILVVMSGAELFTGNTAVLIPTTLCRKISLRKMLRNWYIVFFANLLGSLTVAYFFTHLTGTVAKEPWLSFITSLAEQKVAQSFIMLFFKGIACNWLVCLAVWLAISSDDIVSKIASIWVPIMAFVTLGYEHSIANMFFLPLGMLEGAKIGWLDIWIGNLLPVTIGNVIGGSLFVGAVFWYIYGRESTN
jgi:formate transporter